MLPNITRMDDGAEMTLIERDELARLRQENEALKMERARSGTELETFTIKLLAYHLIQYASAANGENFPTDDEIEQHCNTVIEAVRKKARQILVSYYRETGI